ncbi:phage minor tail protein L [Escherichia coli]|nr:phage minor tail protein L [Escherichia coli]MDX7967692.1 phage minor tail protein L [Escherichia coli]
MQDIHEESLNESVKSEQSPRVVLWEIDLTVQGGERYFFCNELNEKGEAVTWQGRQYQAYPIDGSGFEMNGKGSSARPSLTVSNLFGLVTGMAEDLQSLVGATVVRRRVYARFLDAVNFVAGNPEADPEQELSDRWVVEQMSELTAMTASFVLATPTETDGALFPGRIMLANTCMWDYRGDECGYICLHGDLQRFGRRLSLYVNTAAEAIRALSMQMPGFRRQMNEGWYQIRIRGEDTAPEAVYARLHEPLGEGAVIHIVPRLAGAGKGGLQIVLGAAAIVGSFFTAGASMALWGSALAAGGFSATTMLFSLGASMILGGVAQMLAPKAKVPEYKSTDNGRQNTYFSSLDNMIAQGNPMPVPYGEMLVGSRRISQDISTRDEGGDGKVVVIGRQA